MTSDLERVEAYLADLRTDQREPLLALRARIAAAAPDAVESISYGVPAFRLNGRPLAGYSAAKAHLSYLPFSPAVIETLADRLSGWATSKGAIRFTPDTPLPDDIVAALVQARRAELND